MVRLRNKTKVLQDYCDYRLEMDSFIVDDNEGISEFLNYLRKEYDCSMREFSHDFMDVDYNLGYSILTNRRNTSLGIIFHILKRLGYSMLLVPNSIIDRRLSDGSGTEEAIIKDE
mgnify:FL=1